jgi:cation diffusion facilitator CzcD-associated flavoprotein CzcO
MSQANGRALRIVVLDAGMAGILSAIKLREAGYDNFVIYEKAARLGGTWRENTYPGIACDVRAHLYTYSFEPNPIWSHVFAPGDEIQAYFESVARKYNVLPSIRTTSRYIARLAGWR